MDRIYLDESLSRTRLNYSMALEQLDSARKELNAAGLEWHVVKAEAARKRVERLEDMCGRYRVLLDLHKSA